MKTNEIMGIKILDKNVKEIGKVSEIAFNVKTFGITSVYGSKGNPISKKYFEIKPSEVMALGDYLQVNITKEELEERIIDKIPTLAENTINIQKINGKRVLDSNGNDIGKIAELEIDFDNYKVDTLHLVGNSSFTSRAESMEIDKTDIVGMGDYILINKEIKKQKQEDEEEEEEESSQESVKVDIE